MRITDDMTRRLRWLETLKVGDEVVISRRWADDSAPLLSAVEAVGKGKGRKFKVDGQWYNEVGVNKPKEHNPLMLNIPPSALGPILERECRYREVCSFLSSSFSWSLLTPEEHDALHAAIKPAIDRRAARQAARESGKAMEPECRRPGHATTGARRRRDEC